MKAKKGNKETLKGVHSRIGGGSTLAEISGQDIELSQGSLDTTVTDLVTDSRRVTPGSAFFAITGLRDDGNDFVNEAIERGAKTIVTNNENIELKSLAYKGKELDLSEIKKLASLPTYEEAISMLMSIMQAPVQKLMATMTAVPTKMVRTLDAVKGTKN